MAAWVPGWSRQIRGKLVLPPGQPVSPPAPPAVVDEPSAFDRIAAAIERLYDREPKLTRDLLEAFRSAGVADLERLLLP
jgi:hypothetical protein